ncbi:hypothetical protein Poli38472_005816 [Pythium oligandrum]|uniref:Cyclin-like domain-containing protein n=1 Tax=Pythium oligandrum TaxID=41045 RepID=A0A8K1CU74_PYTOL|nr:hypothetical protein Poli38472_005816 [Pythium oligandrum]|eukprot:TMW68348.1 hypothetical protein Poli38472_005816 [Pythium oligandrum]
MEHTTMEHVVLPEAILARSPSQQDGVSAHEERDHRFWGCELIEEAGILLRLPQVVMVTAQTMLQRFYYRKSLRDFDAFRVAIGCLFLAAKVEEQPKRMREVVSVFYAIYRRRKWGKTRMTQQLLEPESDSYYLWCDWLIMVERQILIDLGFSLYTIMEHPHKYILYYIKILDGSKALAQKAWGYLNDSLRVDLCVRYRAEVIACAAIFLASRMLQVKLPMSPPWFELFDVDETALLQASTVIMELYTRKKIVWLDPLTEVNPFAIDDLPDAEPQAVRQSAAVDNVPEKPVDSTRLDDHKPPTSSTSSPSTHSSLLECWLNMEPEDELDAALIDAFDATPEPLAVLRVPPVNRGDTADVGRVRKPVDPVGIPRETVPFRQYPSFDDAYKPPNAYSTTGSKSTAVSYPSLDTVMPPAPAASQERVSWIPPRASSHPSTQPVVSAKATTTTSAPWIPRIPSPVVSASTVQQPPPLSPATPQQEIVNMTHESAQQHESVKTPISTEQAHKEQEEEEEEEEIVSPVELEARQQLLEMEVAEYQQRMEYVAQALAGLTPHQVDARRKRGEERQEREERRLAALEVRVEHQLERAHEREERRTRILERTHRSSCSPSPVRARDIKEDCQDTTQSFDYSTQ